MIKTQWKGEDKTHYKKNLKSNVNITRTHGERILEKQIDRRRINITSRESTG